MLMCEQLKIKGLEIEMNAQYEMHYTNVWGLNKRNSVGIQG